MTSKIIKTLAVIVYAIIAVILTRFGISYLVILMALGLIVSLIHKQKKEAIASGVLYALISYILSYPAGMFLINYMPKYEIPVQTNTTATIINLVIGALIPMIIALVICTITAVIGSTIAGYFQNNEKRTAKKDKKDNFIGNVKQKRKTNRITQKEKEDMIMKTPIQKAMEKKRKRDD